MHIVPFLCGFLRIGKRLRLVRRSGIDPQRIDALLASVNAVESLQAPLIVPFVERQREAVGRMEGIGAQCRVGPYARSTGEARRDDREPVVTGSREGPPEKSHLAGFDMRVVLRCDHFDPGPVDILLENVVAARKQRQQNKSAQAVRNRSAEPVRRIGIVPDVERDSDSHVSAPPAGKSAESLSVRIGVCGRTDGRRAETAGGNGLSDRISYHKGLRFIGQLLDNEGQQQRGLPSPADRFELRRKQTAAGEFPLRRVEGPQ